MDLQIKYETVFIPKGLNQIFKRCGTPELVASLILSKALMLSKKKGHCTMTDSFIQSLICGASRAQIQRALSLLKSNNLISLKRSVGENFGQRVIYPNIVLIEEIQRSQNDTSVRSHNNTLEILKQDNHDPKKDDLRSSSDTPLILNNGGLDPKTSQKIKKIRNIREIRIYIERFLLNFYKRNIEQLFNDKDIFHCDLAEAKKTIPFDGGPYEELSDWIYTNIKEWARELLSCKYFVHDNAGRCDFNLEPVLDYALGHYDPSKGVHFLDYFQTVLLNNCKILFRKHREGEDNYLETFGRLFDRLMLQKWLYQKDTGQKLTVAWPEAHYFAFDPTACKVVRKHCREGYDFNGFDLIAKQFVGSKELITVIYVWHLHFCLYRFRGYNDIHERWPDIFKFIKNEDVFLNTTEETLLNHFKTIWPVFDRGCKQFSLPIVSFDDVLNAVFEEKE